MQSLTNRQHIWSQKCKKYHGKTKLVGYLSCIRRQVVNNASKLVQLTTKICLLQLQNQICNNPTTYDKWCKVLWGDLNISNRKYEKIFTNRLCVRWSNRRSHALQPLRVCSRSLFGSLPSSTCVCGCGLTSVGLHVLQQVVVELELDATGTTSVVF